MRASEEGGKREEVKKGNNEGTEGKRSVLRAFFPSPTQVCSWFSGGDVPVC